MQENKKDAVKRTRPLKTRNHLPVIIGLSVGIVVLVVVLILVWVFVLRKKPDSNDGNPAGQTSTESSTESGALFSETDVETESESESEGEPESETDVPAAQSLTENETETEPQTSAEDESGTIPEADTEAESEAEQSGISDTEVPEEVKGILDTMSLKQKVDQLFIITPLALIKAYDPNQTTIEQVGDTTKAAYKAYPVGGIVVRPYKIDNIAVFIDNSRALSEELGTVDVPLLIAMTEEDEETFRSRNDVFSTDILIAATAQELEYNTLTISVRGADLTAETAAELLQEGTDLILVADDEFDYATVRKELVDIIETGEDLTADDIDEILVRILTQKLAADLAESETESEGGIEVLS